MATPGKRPFWMHQIAEYIIAAVFIAQGLQSPTPVVPTVLGGLVLLNAACTKGGASAFRLIGRKLHRLLDLVVIGIIVVMAVQPVVSIDNSTRLIMGVLAFVIGFVWLGSDFSASVKREQSRTAATGARVAGGLRQVSAAATPRKTSSTASASSTASTASPTASKPARQSGSRAEDVGRTAGRLAGKGVNMYRSRKARPAPPDK
jgi:hypothetical protein